MKEQLLLQFLERILGSAQMVRDGQEAMFYCPLCKHHKRKLSINLPTQKMQCWVCSFKTNRVKFLLKKIKVPQNQWKELNEIDKIYKLKTTKHIKEEPTILQLPKEFKPLYLAPNSTLKTKAFNYLINERGLTKIDIIKYNIGFCIEGEFRGMVILPSYDSDGVLNYYVGRSFVKNNYFTHKLAKSNKDIIGFDYYINWNLPVVICESPLDAISVKRNAIPLFGKKIHGTLYKKLISSNTRKIYLALDDDALRNSIKYAEELISYGKKVYLLDLNGKDPNEVGFEGMLKILHKTKPLTFSKIMKLKFSVST